MYGIAKHLRRSEELLRAVHLADKRDAYSRTLSGGMKRRLLIA
jgi:ABC-2 type transport system ATP-binding protein